MKFEEVIKYLKDNDFMEIFYEEVDCTKPGQTIRLTPALFDMSIEPDETVPQFDCIVNVFQKDMNVYDGARSYIYLEVDGKFYVCYYDYSSWDSSNWSGPEEVDPPKQKTVWVFE